MADVLRGAAWPGNDSVSYPRADPDDKRLPEDTWAVAQVPAGVRLEVVGDATALEIDYNCATGDLGYRGNGAGITFAAWRGDTKVSEVPAVVGDATVTVPLGDPASPFPAVVHLPEGMRPTILAVRAVGGDAQPAPPGPRWLAYGDSITEGWIASEPGLAWPSIVGRRHNLDLVNLGYAGSCRGELCSAEQIAALDADIISVAFGTNCWARPPHSAEMMREVFTTWMDVVRAGHPGVPMVVVSPIHRPDAEAGANEQGATLADLREVIESLTTERQATDKLLWLVHGEPIIKAANIPDGVHPDDEGQWVMADVIGSEVARRATG